MPLSIPLDQVAAAWIEVYDVDQKRWFVSWQHVDGNRSGSDAINTKAEAEAIVAEVERRNPTQNVVAFRRNAAAP